MPENYPDRHINSPLGRYSYEFRPEGRPVFRKTVVDPEVAHLLDGERLWHDFATALYRGRPELRVRSPRLIDFEPGRSIEFEFIDAPFVADASDTSYLKDNVDRLAGVLAAMDELGGSWVPTVSIDAGKERAPYDRIDMRWDTWMEKPLQAGIVTEEMVATARALVRRLEGHIEPRLQHGDFTPWHIFHAHDGEWLIFDGEHASPFKPRYYDVAYCYSRIFTRLDDPALAAAILRSFMEQSALDKEDLAAAFLPVLTSRTMGMFIDALNDRNEVDYIAAAQDLYQRCVSGDLDRLT